MTQPLARPLTTENRMLRAVGASQIVLPGSVGVGAAFNTPTMGDLALSGAAQIAAGAPDQSPDQIMAEQEGDAAARQEAAQLSARLDFADAAEREVLLDQIDGLMTRRKVRVDTRTKQAVADGKMQAPEALAEQYADLGLKFDRAMTPAEAKLIADGRKAQIVREALIAQTPGGVKQGLAMFGAGLLAMATDPLEVATMFIPVVGQAGKAAAIARFGRVGGRVAIGVTEGAVGSALTEPVYMGLSRSQQLDYTMSDALMNVGLGAVLGGGIGTVAGLLARRAPDARADAVLTPDAERIAAPPERIAAPMAADAPVRAEAAPDAAVRAADTVEAPVRVDAAPEAADVARGADTRALAAEQRQAADTALRQFVNGRGVDVAEVMPQGRTPASWVIIDKETGKAVMETFQESVAAKVNTEKFQAVPILDYLVSINGRPKDASPQPTLSKPPTERLARVLDGGETITSITEPKLTPAEKRWLKAEFKAGALESQQDATSRVVRYRRPRPESDATWARDAPTAATKRPAEIAASLAKAANESEPLANPEAAAAFARPLPDSIESDIADMEQQILQMRASQASVADADPFAVKGWQDVEIGAKMDDGSILPLKAGEIFAAVKSRMDAAQALLRCMNG